ncbi:hypothetical protein ASNO1_73940 [Corallococcus caeni]|uniref:Uncharacterized protein n=1 Tax=Corallococcus caeni TaxID=3082388 RepID=A0ABQ6R497_9BACT|nr:hypothetical protein ASNO1_73940 [Corallococcus sp. NO1]
MTCTGPSESGRKVVRSDSCRCTTSSRARRRASRFSAPVSRSENGMLYAAEPGSNCSSTQSRCCAKDAGSLLVRDTGTTGGGPAKRGSFVEAAMRAARSATVGDSNNACRGRSTWYAVRNRDVSRVASSEWPPSSKKLSVAPTRCTFRSDA